MAEHFASGNWHVKKGNEEEFVERWKEFLQWTHDTQKSLVSANLIRDERDPSHFISFAEWGDSAARDAWRDEPGFAERFAACRALCEDFYGGDYGRAVSV